MGHRSKLEDKYTVRCPLCDMAFVDPKRRPGAKRLKEPCWNCDALRVDLLESPPEKGEEALRIALLRAIQIGMREAHQGIESPRLSGKFLVHGLCSQYLPWHVTALRQAYSTGFYHVAICRRYRARFCATEAQ